MLLLDKRVAKHIKRLKECGVDLSSIWYNIPVLKTDKPYNPEYDKELNSEDYSLYIILGKYLI